MCVCQGLADETTKTWLYSTHTHTQRKTQTKTESQTDRPTDMEADTEIARVWEGASSCDRADGQMEFWAQSRWTQIENHSHPAALICRASFIALPQVSLGNSKARLLLKP